MKRLSTVAKRASAAKVEPRSLSHSLFPCRTSNIDRLFYNNSQPFRLCSTTAPSKSATPKPSPYKLGGSWRILVALTATAIVINIKSFPTLHAEAPTTDPSSVSSEEEPPDPKPLIRLSEVRSHGRASPQKWVTKGTKVYDITDLIPNHPGGEVILSAVGGAIDSYWNIFSIHRKQDVYDILDSFYIGEVDPRDLVDGKVPVGEIDDPFANDPVRDPRLIVLGEKPFNAETPGEGLDAFITPEELFYVRQHFWVPETRGEGHKVVVELPDGEEVEYSVDELRRKFRKATVTATLQCSGNRRKHMSKESRSTKGLQWDFGAVSNAEWTGVRLRDVLADAGLDVDDPPEQVKHAQFTGAEAYGASIPIQKAVDKLGDVLLAYEMNGRPLAPDHGYPVRVIVPGTVAARSVKWLSRIILSEEESPSQWQRRDYKCFGPNVGSNDADWDSAPAIQEMPVQSAITSIRLISLYSAADRRLLQVYGLEEDSVLVEGYSFSGGGRRIVRVDVSADDGRSWHQAEFLQDESKGAKSWAWTRWRWVLPRWQVGRNFVVKAIDEAYNTQPGQYEPAYNFRGNLTNAWHRVEYRPNGE